MQFPNRGVLQIFPLLLLVLLHFFAGPAWAGEIYSFERMWPVLNQPWYFFRPYDVAVDRNGFVYVADTHNHRIQKFTSDGHFLTRWGTKGGGNDQFYYPYGISTDPRTGHVYVADTFNERIKRYDANGALDTVWANQGILKDGFEKPYAVAVDESGYLYVADTGNHRILHYDPEGKRIGQPWGGQGLDPGKFEKPRGILAADGFIYVADTGNHRIQKFRADGSFVDAWGEQGKENGNFDLPTDIAADRHGYLYVADNFNDRVQKLTDQGVYVAQWGQESSAPGNFVSPTGIAVFDEYVFVADWNNRRIQKFTKNGTYMAQWAGSGSGPGAFIRPRGIALDAAGSTYVADTNNHRIQKFGAQGEFLLEWGEEGSGDGQLSAPFDVTVHGDTVYVADTLNDRIQVFTTGGEYVDQWGSEGVNDGRFDDPAGIAVDEAGNVYVSDWRNHRIQKFDAEWTHVDSWGDWGTGGGEFIEPQGLTVHGGFVYVADQGNHRIQKLTTDGMYVTQWGENGTGDGRFRQPTDVTADAAGNLYVADSQNHRFEKFDPVGNFLGEHGSEGSDAGQMKAPAAVAVDGDGRIYVSDTENNRIQVFQAVTDPVDNRAVIVAGGGPYPGNYLWDATQMTANFAYRVLTYQGFDKESIHYLSPDTTLDLDNNGLPDDVDGAATLANLETALTAWAAGADNVIVFLTDHGKDAVFRMNQTEILSATVLDGWLDRLQATISGRLIIIYDACSAGAFLPELAAPDRIVIAGADAEENAWFIGQGSVSFSGFFWTHLFNGSDLAEAFSLARAVLANVTALQNPQIDGDGDGRGNNPEDLAAAQGVRIVNTTDSLNAAPVFTKVMGDLTLSGDDTAVLHAAVTDADGIGRVWAVIRPPAFQQGTNDTILDFPNVDLMPAGSGRFEAAWDRLDQAGTYQVTLCARDRRGNTATTDPVSITVGTPLTPKAVILAGFTRDDSDLASGIEANARLAHDTLTFQGYGHGDITQVLCEADTDLGALDDAVAEWTAGNTRDMVLYLIGQGSGGGFRMSAGEILTPAALAQWIDDFQAAVPVEVTVICDFDAAGAFLPVLSRPDRMILAGTTGDQPAVIGSVGAVSFSAFFWRRIGEGWSAGHAFDAAKNAMTLFTGGGGEGPLMDDNGNGIGNERLDGSRADQYYLGAGVRRTADTPQINGAPSDLLTVSGGGTVPLSVTDISAAHGIDRVWAVVSPPGFGSGVQVLAPETFPMTDAGGGTYQTDIAVSPFFGYSAIAVYAEDNQNDISIATEVTIFKTDGKDIYEIDDSRENAGTLVINDPQPQHHNLHHSTDVDWMAFYGVAGMTYEIGVEPKNMSYGLTTTLVDAPFTPIWPCPADGIYYLRIAPENPDSWEPGGGYEVEIVLPTAPFAGFVMGLITDAAGQVIPFAAVTTTANASGLSRYNGRYLMIQKPGTFQATVQADGYEPVTKTVVIGEGGTTILNFTLTRASIPQPPTDTFPAVRILSPDGDTRIYAGDSLFFQGAVVQGEAPFVYRWNFSGGAKNANVLTPGNVNFDRPGTFSAILTVTDADGDTAVVSVNIIVASRTMTDLRLEASSENTAPGEAVEFQVFFDGGTPPISFHWDFDGAAQNREGETPGAVVFENPGTYTVTVTLTDANGETASISRVIIVQEAGAPDEDTRPIIYPSLPSEMTLHQGESVVFQAETTQGNPPYTYLWDFGGGADNRTVLNPGEVVFNTPGTYLVRLWVTDGDGDRASFLHTVTVLATPHPFPPVIMAPLIEDANIPLMPVLRTEPFTHTRPEDNSHAETHWILAADSEFSRIALDISSDAYLTELPVPALVLEPEMTYFFKARFVDDAGQTSSWSEPGVFTTPAGGPADNNRNGIPDLLEIDGTVDTDQNGQPDLDQEALRCVAGPKRDSAVCVDIRNAAIHYLTVLDPEIVSDSNAIPDGMVYGLIGLRVTVDTPGDAADITLHLSHPVPSGTGWQAFDSVNHWRPLAVSVLEENRAYHLETADGGEYDADGASNGIIVLSSGPGIARQTGISISGPDQGNVGGAGCFLEMLMF